MQRELKLDGLKFLMIFLVVLGHMSYQDWGLETGKMIYAFHMPVFVFLSGYFTSRNTEPVKRVAWLKHTALIYVLAQLVYVFLCAGLGNTALVNWRGLVLPGFALWYLVSLIIWRFAVWYVFPKQRGAWLLVLSGMMAALSGLVPLDKVFSFQRSFALFPFFVAGMLFRERGLMGRLESVPAACAWGLLTAGLLLAHFLPIYMPHESYEGVRDFLLRLGQTALGFVLCLSVVRLSRIRFVEYFAPFGRYTLWVYVGHIYLITLGDKFFPIWGVRLNLLSAILLAAVYCAFFVALAKLYHHGFRYRSGV